MSKKKYQKGKLIESFDEFNKQEYVWFHGKVYHSGWFKSWQFRYVEGQLKHGNLFTVEPIERPVRVKRETTWTNSMNYYCSCCSFRLHNPSYKFCPNCGEKFKDWFYGTSY